MKKLCIIFFVFLLGIIVFSEERELHIGDKINIKIKNTDMTLNEIKNKFENFEIEFIEEVNGGYNITFTSFDPGVHEVQIGNKTIKIDVKSTLEEEKEILSKSDNKKSNFLNENIKRPFPITIFLYILITIIIVSIIIFLITTLLKQKRKNKEPSPFVLFQKIENEINNVNFLFILTHHFKKYMKNKFDILLLGKTSGEIYNELLNYSIFNEVSEEFYQLSEKIDFIKFTGGESSTKDHTELYNKTLDIIKILEAKEVNNIDKIS